MSPEFMLVTFVLFLAGSIAVPIASLLGLGSVLGYLIAGIVISPMFNVMGVDVAALQHFAEFGIVMMLFLIGLEMRPRELWLMRSKIFVMGGATNLPHDHTGDDYLNGFWICLDHVINNRLGLCSVLNSHC